MVMIINLVQQRAASNNHRGREEPVGRAVGRRVLAGALRAFYRREASISLLAADAADAAVDQGHG